MIKLLDLPDELLITTLRHYRGLMTLNQAWQSLTVCKKLYEIGYPVLLEHIKLTDNNLEPFQWSFKIASRLFANLKSLTLQIRCAWPINEYERGFQSDHERRTNLESLDEFNCYRFCTGEDSVLQKRADGEKTTRNLKNFSILLPHISENLKSFSLIIDAAPNDLPWCFCSAPWIGNHIIAKIILGLPQSCTNIHIDTGGADYEHQKSAIGKALASKKLNIENLWICVYTEDICLFMYEQEADDLDLPGNIELEALRLWRLEVRPLEEYQYDEFWEIFYIDRDLEEYKLWKSRPLSEREVYMAMAQENLQNTGLQRAQIQSQTWPNLKSLTINNCFYPIRSAQDRKNRVPDLAKILANYNFIFPKLKQCIILESTMDIPSPAKVQMIKDHGTLSWVYESLWQPLSTIVVWDVTEDKTHVLPIYQVMGNEARIEGSATYQTLHLLHDQCGKIHHGSFHQMNRVVCDSFASGWKQSSADRMLIPANLFCEIQGASANTEPWEDIIRALAILGGGLDLYLRAWTARSYTRNGLVSRVEAIWERASLGLSHKAMSSVELRRLALYYVQCCRSPSPRFLLVSPWIAGWLADGKVIAESNWRYWISPI